MKLLFSKEDDIPCFLSELGMSNFSFIRVNVSSWYRRRLLNCRRRLIFIGISRYTSDHEVCMQSLTHNILEWTTVAFCICVHRYRIFLVNSFSLKLDDSGCNIFAAMITQKNEIRVTTQCHHSVSPKSITLLRVRKCQSCVRRGSEVPRSSRVPDTGSARPDCHRAGRTWRRPRPYSRPETAKAVNIPLWSGPRR